MSSGIIPRNIPVAQRLFVALDVPSAGQACALAEQLAPLGVSFKVGMQLFYAEGMPVVKAIQPYSPYPVFVDLKLHDIPNTVAGAIQSLVSQGVGFLNVHAQGGPEMMEAAAEAAMQANTSQNKPTIIAVTLLTSIAPDVLKQQLLVHDSAEAYVVHLAKMTQEAGLDGVVCSPQEVKAIRAACGKDFLLVTPGVRPKSHTAGSDDQSRVMTPGEALAAGSDMLVVGRPITAAANPLEAAQAILDEMSAAIPAAC